MQGDNFTFVGLSGQVDLDIQATNKLVRSHVMRRYRRQQKSTSPKEEDSQLRVEDKLFPDSCSAEDFPSLAIFPYMDISPNETTWLDLWTAICPRTKTPARQNIATREQQSTSAYHSTSSDIRTWLDGEIDPFSSLLINMNQRSLVLLRQSKFLL